MLLKDWFNYMATLLLSNANGVNTQADVKQDGQDGELGPLCPCITSTPAGEVSAEKANRRILKLHTEDGNIDEMLEMPDSRSITTAQTVFTLYVREGSDNGTRIYADDIYSLMVGGYRANKNTIVAAHGFHSNDSTEWMIQLRKAQLSAVDCNFISVDWSECANNCCYFGARDCAIAVGRYLEQLLQTLIFAGADPMDIHLMGHSLGAHLVSQVSSNGLRIGRISAFDPPKWGFDLEEPKHRIDPLDAELVDVIHTTSTLGWNEVLGHLDFFPNGAGRQPGCSFFNTVCSHSMSYFYYIQSIYHNKKYPANRCENLQAAGKGKCNGSTAFMGVDSFEGEPGIYYLSVTEPATGDP